MPRESTNILLLYLFVVAFLCVEPAMANKFETIGSGITGSPKLKIEYLKVIAYVAGVIMLGSGVLSIILRKKNAQHLNYTLWKPSSILFFLLGLVALWLGYYL